MWIHQHTHETLTQCKGRSTLRDKVLWVTGLVSKINVYAILTEVHVNKLARLSVVIFKVFAKLSFK